MIDEPLAKVGLAGVMLGAVWLLTLGVDRAGGYRVTERSALEGALIPEIATRIEPESPKEAKHTGLLVLSVPKVRSIDPGSVRIVTPGYTADASEVKPVTEYRKPEKPKPRSIILVLDNSMSMIRDTVQGPASDPDYRRLDACHRLLDSLSESTDKVSLAVFPCRDSRETKHSQTDASSDYDVVGMNKRPSQIAGLLDSLRGEENYTTPLFEAAEKAASSFGDDDGRQRIMLLLTDGKPSTWSFEALQRATAAIRSKHVDTYGVALGAGADEATLRRFAPHVLRADDAGALDKTFKDVIEQISREVVQVDLNVVVGRVGGRIPAGQPLEVEFRSDGKLYRMTGTAK